MAWSVVEVPSGAATNDVNTTTALALLVSHATLYTGFKEYKLSFPTKYLKPVPFLLPISLGYSLAE